MQTLRYGMQGLFVRYAQLALQRAGLETGETDGIFGRRTLRATEQFQTVSGIAADGVIGRLTWGALFPYLSGYSVYVRTEGETLTEIQERLELDPLALRTANPDLSETGDSDGETVILPLPFSVVTDAVPPSYVLTGIWLDGLAARYPFLASEVIGASRMGKQIFAVSVGTGSARVGMNASHHANEWITTTLTLTMLEQYLAALSKGETVGGVSARELSERSTLTLVPLVNPDGVDLVTGALPAEDSYYRQAKELAAYYPQIPFPSGWKANIAGVDLNLGYPADWERARELKFAQGFTRPGPRDYVGIAPLTEPENMAMFRRTIEDAYELTVSFHTQGAEIYWRYQDVEPIGAEEIGKVFSEVSGYRLADAPYGSSFAGYKDWFLDAFRRPGYTVEAGRGVNPLPIDDLPQLIKENLGIFVQALRLTPEGS